MPVDYEINYATPSDGYGLRNTRIESMVKTIVVINLTYRNTNRTRDAILGHLKKSIKAAKRGRPQPDVWKIPTKQRLLGNLNLESSGSQPLGYVKSGLSVVKNVNQAALSQLAEHTGAPGKVVSQTYNTTTGSITVINLFHPAAITLTGGAQLLLSPTSALMAALHLSALNPLTLVLFPWINALKVYSMSGKNMGLKDIAQAASNYGTNRCSCGHCQNNLTFIIDRSDWFAFQLGVSATVVGAPFAMGYRGLRKMKNKFKGTNSEKHQVAKSLWEAAQIQGNMTVHLDKDEQSIHVKKMGCPRAIKIIAMLFGGLDGGGVAPAIAAICANSTSGIRAIKGAID